MTSTDPRRHDHGSAPVAQPGRRPRGLRHRHPARCSSSAPAWRLRSVVCAIIVWAGLPRPRSSGGGAGSADFAARPACRAVAGRARISRPNERAALAKFRAEETKALDGYGWVNQPGGVTHIPVDEAKKLLVQRGAAGAPGRGRCARRHACSRDGRSVGRTDDRRQRRPRHQQPRR